MSERSAWDSNYGDDHSCRGKARVLEKRLRIWLGMEQHDIISEMCNMWGTANPQEFYDKMNAMSDDELRSYVEEAKKRVRRKKALLGKKVEETIYN